YAGMNILNYDEIPEDLQDRARNSSPDPQKQAENLDNISMAYTQFKRQELDTMVFNTFVFLQIFNEVNCRRLDNHLNIFAGIQRNNYFIVIFIIMVVFQIIIVQFGGAAFDTEKLGGIQWLICLLLGLLSIPVGVIIRLIPEELFGGLKQWVNRPGLPRSSIPTFDNYGVGSGGSMNRVNSNHSNRAGSMMDGSTTTNVYGSPSYGAPGRDGLVWNSAITKVRSDLSVFKSIRGGRLSGESERHVLHAGAMLPSLVATSVGAGWAPRPSPLNQTDLGVGSPRSSMMGSRRGSGANQAGRSY
ncbi:hypothetical protein BGW39_003140, partial [Mortierella sp. 14UC]